MPTGCTASISDQMRHRTRSRSERGGSGGAGVSRRVLSVMLWSMICSTLCSSLAIRAYGIPSRLAVEGCGAAPAAGRGATDGSYRSEKHTAELQSLRHVVCRLLLE